MQKLTWFVAMCCVVVLQFGCGSADGPDTAAKPTDDIPEVTVTQDQTSGYVAPADTAANEGDAQAEVYVIDVRSKEEWDAGHVDCAIHIPHTDIVQRIKEVTTDKNAKICFY